MGWLAVLVSLLGFANTDVAVLDVIIVGIGGIGVV